jgi:hypothetical protein
MQGLSAGMQGLGAGQIQAGNKGPVSPSTSIKEHRHTLKGHRKGIPVHGYKSVVGADGLPAGRASTGVHAQPIRPCFRPSITAAGNTGRRPAVSITGVYGFAFMATHAFSPLPAAQPLALALSTA